MPTDEEIERRLRTLELIVQQLLTSVAGLNTAVGKLEEDTRKRDAVADALQRAAADTKKATENLAEQHLAQSGFQLSRNQFYLALAVYVTSLVLSVLALII